jgi:transcriptional regulator NrdR family protein
MKCPKCGGATRVFKTVSPRGRRECLDCGHRFSTRENLLTPEDKALIRRAAEASLKAVAERNKPRDG